LKKELYSILNKYYQDNKEFFEAYNREISFWANYEFPSIETFSVPSDLFKIRESEKQQAVCSIAGFYIADKILFNDKLKKMLTSELNMSFSDFFSSHIPYNLFFGEYNPLPDNNEENILYYVTSAAITISRIMKSNEKIYKLLTKKIFEANALYGFRIETENNETMDFYKESETKLLRTFLNNLKIADLKFSVIKMLEENSSFNEFTFKFFIKEVLEPFSNAPFYPYAGKGKQIYSIAEPVISRLEKIPFEGFFFNINDKHEIKAEKILYHALFSVVNNSVDVYSFETIKKAVKKSVGGEKIHNYLRMKEEIIENKKNEKILKYMKEVINILTPDKKISPDDEVKKIMRFYLDSISESVHNIIMLRHLEINEIKKEILESFPEKEKTFVMYVINEIFPFSESIEKDLEKNKYCVAGFLSKMKKIFIKESYKNRKPLEDADYFLSDPGKVNYFYKNALNNPGEIELFKILTDGIPKDADSVFFYNRFTLYFELLQNLFGTESVDKFKKFYKRINENEILKAFYRNPFLLKKNSPFFGEYIDSHFHAAVSLSYTHPVFADFMMFRHLKYCVNFYSLILKDENGLLKIKNESEKYFHKEKNNMKFFRFLEGLNKGNLSKKEKIFLFSLFLKESYQKITKKNILKINKTIIKHSLAERKDKNFFGFFNFNFFENNEMSEFVKTLKKTESFTPGEIFLINLKTDKNFNRLFQSLVKKEEPGKKQNILKKEPGK